jgi:hypothetical protein
MLGFKQNLFDKGKTHFHLIFKPFTAFFSSYFKEVLWMDSGLALASVNAYGVFSLCKNNFNRKNLK